MTQPLDTDLLGLTDQYIRNLAERADSKLNASLKLSVVNAVSVSANANGDVSVVFPGLNTITGAIIVPRNRTTGYGAVTTLPPVPPSNVGRIVGATPIMAVITVLSMGGGNVGVRLLTTPWQGSASSGVTPWYGSQNAAGGTTVTLNGIAWGPA